MQRMKVALVKPLHSGDPDVMQFSHGSGFERPAPSHATEVQAPCYLSCYLDLHASN